MTLQNPVPPVPPTPPEVIIASPPIDMIPPPVFLLIAITFLVVCGAVLWPLARALARRIEGGGGGELRRELEDLRVRVQQLESEQAQLAELEERVDFTERLLAQQRNAGDLPR